MENTVGNIWELNTTSSTHLQGGSAQGLVLPNQTGNYLYLHRRQQQHSLYAGDGSHVHPDPHLTCLKLGKRHYFEDSNNHSAGCGDGQLTGLSIGKRGKPYYVGPSSSAGMVGSTAASVPRCQVEGCHVALINAKDYHRRHKVCEMHSKAPKVIVLGLEQRFCQQCSRFHVVSEFDESKRSCRRRLAGHNERRRKSCQDSTGSKNSTSQADKLIMGRFQYLTSATGCALSLLSSKADSWVSPSDISSRSSAALRELIAEHRAAILARHLHHHAMQDLCETHPSSNIFTLNQHQLLAEPNGWDRFHDNGTHLTLDLMQAPSSAFGFLSTRGKNEEEEVACAEVWNTFERAHVV